MNLLEVPPAGRLPILILGMICLLTAVLGGLARLAIDVPNFAQYQAGAHGALMIAGFFGTVISLERAVALHRFWPYLAPLCAGLGGVVLLAPCPVVVSPILFCLSGALFLVASWLVYRQMPAIFTFTLFLGALSLLLGNLVWLLRAEISVAMPFWMSFLVLTIAGERLELTRLLPPKPVGRRIFIGLLGLIVLAACLILFAVPYATQLLAACWLILALWLLRYDIARRTVRQTGLTRFVAVCLLLGYGWLAVGGFLGLGAPLFKVVQLLGGGECGQVWVGDKVQQQRHAKQNGQQQEGDYATQDAHEQLPCVGVWCVESAELMPS